MPSVPLWLDALSWASLVIAGLCAVTILADVVRGRRFAMPIMGAVWPVTALYLGPVALVFYRRFGRRRSRGEGAGGSERPRWHSRFVSASHCGAGCTLGDILADTLIGVFGIAVVPSALGTSYLLDFAAAYAFGILFQYLPIRQMGEPSRLRALWGAIKADTLSLTAFEIGLFGWMALVRLVWFPGLGAGTALFWFMMQIGMVVGFATTWPANVWLIRVGIKQAM